MTFQEILEGITRHRTHRATVTDPEIQRKFEEIEWALQAMAEALRDREQELSAIAPHERAGHSADYTVGDPVDDVDEVEAAFEAYGATGMDEKRK